MKEFDLFLNSQLLNTNPRNIHNHFDLGQVIDQFVTNEGYIQKSQTVAFWRAGELINPWADVTPCIPAIWETGESPQAVFLIQVYS